MPNYNYYCSKCDLNYVDLRTYETRNEPFTCEECGTKKCPLTYDMSKNAEGGSKSGVVNKTMGQTVFYDKTGSRESQEKQFMEGAVEGAKTALKYESGKSPYSRRQIPYEQLEKEGTLKRVSEKEKNARVKAGQRVVREAGKNMSKMEIERAGKRGDSN
mgnify:FL=1|tara:strand:+ start:209 stop:685 length:477 start_codon:yes stop_codon:yes gene_type:complete